ncbi:MAG: hypothetical protein M3203_11540, partial [Actinomycetota bacterium]|nr:hypothetical protein [Actinomycetota bacterium]
PSPSRPGQDGAGMSRWLRLFPKPWRDRYGGEVDEVLERSRRSGLADGLDLLAAAPAVWADHLRDRRTTLMRTVRAVAVMLVAVGGVAVTWAVTELQGGIAELPSHWWSGLATVPLLAGLALSWLAWRPRASRR